MKALFPVLSFWLLLALTTENLQAQNKFRVFPYLQHPTTDGMTILWFSDDNSPGKLLWWKNNAGISDSVNSEPVKADALAYTSWESNTFFSGHAPEAPFKHRVRLKDLESGTKYRYRVIQGEDTFSSFFETAPSGNDSIRFIVYSDCETEPESTGKPTSWTDPITGTSRKYLIDQTTGYGNNLSVIRSRHPDLVLISGDIAQHGGEQRDWNEFWRHNTNSDSALSLAGCIPIITAPGNHDYYEGPKLGQYNQPGSERAINRYLTYFEEPENKSPNKKQEGRYYSFKYGSISFIVLDLCNNSPNGSDEDTNFYLLGENDPEGGNAPDFGEESTQYKWLIAQLKEAQKNSVFTFVVFHHIPYSSGPHGFSPGIGDLYDNQSGVPTRALTPIFMRYGVDAVFSGHDEMWERSEISGIKIDPVKGEVNHSIHFYDVGIGGDGLRGATEGANNPYQKFLVHTDVPEVWENGILVGGGKHYGHLEVIVKQINDSTWQANLTPAYVFPLYNANESAYSGYERREYDDKVILTKKVSKSTSSIELKKKPTFTSKVFPNPFYGKTTIKYVLPETKNVSITIHDISGKLVRLLKEGAETSGQHTAIWNGKDDTGKQVASGLYYYLLKTGVGQQLSGKMFLLN
jgi:hypothetical protein